MMGKGALENASAKIRFTTLPDVLFNRFAWRTTFSQTARLMPTVFVGVGATVVFTILSMAHILAHAVICVNNYFAFI